MKQKLIYLLLPMLLVTTFAIAQSKEESAVAIAVESLRKAMVDGNRDGLDKITASELSYGHSGGKIEDKTTFIEALASGNSDFVSIELTDQTIQVTGNVAIVRHTLSGATNDKGKQPGTVKLYVLLVWQKQHNEWKLLARQAVKVPEAGK